MKQNTSWAIPMACCVALGLAALLVPLPSACEEIFSDTAKKVATGHILDGKKFFGPTGEKGKKGHHEDMLIFKDGMFTSSECLQYGFNSGPYTATVDDHGIKFRAETVSRTLGKMEWQGTLKGDILDVTYTWTKERWLWTTFRQYWFKGRLTE